MPAKNVREMSRLERIHYSLGGRTFRAIVLFCLIISAAAVVFGFVLFTATVYVVINLLIDLCYRWIDPRLRGTGGDAR